MGHKPSKSSRRIRGGVTPVVMPSMFKYTQDPERMKWVQSLYSNVNSLRYLVHLVQNDYEAFSPTLDLPIEITVSNDRQDRNYKSYFFTVPSVSLDTAQMAVKGGAAYELINDSEEFLMTHTFDTKLHNFTDPTGDFDVAAFSPCVSSESEGERFINTAIAYAEKVNEMPENKGKFISIGASPDVDETGKTSSLIRAVLDVLFESTVRHLRDIVKTYDVRFAGIMPMALKELQESLQTSSMKVQREAFEPSNGFQHTQVGDLHVVAFFSRGAYPRCMVCLKAYDVIDHAVDFMLSDSFNPQKYWCFRNLKLAMFRTPSGEYTSVKVFTPAELMVDNIKALLESRLPWLYGEGGNYGEGVKDKMVKAINHLARMVYLLETALRKVGMGGDYVTMVKDMMRLQLFPEFIRQNGMRTKVFRRAQSLKRLDFTKATFPYYKLSSSGRLDVVQVPLPLFLNAYGPLFPQLKTGFKPFDKLLRPSEFQTAHNTFMELVEDNGRRMARLRHEMMTGDIQRGSEAVRDREWARLAQQESDLLTALHETSVPYERQMLYKGAQFNPAPLKVEEIDD